MNRVCVILALLLLGVGVQRAQAQEPLRDDEQVQAATARAVRQLLNEIAQTPIDDKITVRDFLDLTRGEDELLATVQRAEQIGGPRWMEGGTCQVQLEISGERVARTLNQIAASKPQRSPIAPDVLAVRLEKWRTRSFASTGSSTAAEQVEALTPPVENDNWASVSDAARRKAIGDAKFDAVVNVFDSIADIKLSGDLTVGHALEIDAVGDRMHEWFASRPITNLKFCDSLEVEIDLAAPPDEMAEVFGAALAEQDRIPALSDGEWERVKDAIIAFAAPAVGVASVPGEAMQTTQASLRISAQQPPDWIDQRITADGCARQDSSKLRSARAAEANAIDKVASQIRKLALNNQFTIGDAARQDQRIEEAIQRSLPHARVLKSDYDRPDGTTGVSVELELRELWEELLLAQ